MDGQGRVFGEMSPELCSSSSGFITRIRNPRFGALRTGASCGQSIQLTTFQTHSMPIILTRNKFYRMTHEQKWKNCGKVPQHVTRYSRFQTSTVWLIVYIRRLLIFILPTKKPSFIIYFITNLIHIQFTQLFYLLLIDLIRLKHFIFTYIIQHNRSVV
jgi:hypothetical protein